MKADCQNCRHFQPDVEMQMKLGMCKLPHIMKPITDFRARNCDGFGWEKKHTGSLEVDNGDNGIRYPCPECGVHHA